MCCPVVVISGSEEKLLTECEVFLNLNNCGFNNCYSNGVV